MVNWIYTKDCGYNNEKHAVFAYEDGNEHDEAILKIIDAILASQPSCYNCKHFMGINTSKCDSVVCAAFGGDVDVDDPRNRNLDADDLDGRTCNEYKYDEDYMYRGCFHE